MTKEIKDYLRYRFKVFIVEYAQITKNKKVYEEYNISKSTFYLWKRKYLKEGKDGLIRKKPIARNHPNDTPNEVIDKVLELRKSYQLGSMRIKWYLERYHGINISESTVYRILKRNGMGKLNKKASRRTVHTKRYSKKVPGHHVQVDVKFVSLRNTDNQLIRKFQYTAIDDATRIRALKIYSKHNQASAIDFVDYFVKKFPFRINTIRTDRGHEFQAKFHWHVEDQGMRHHYIKPRSPYLNGKVERSHRTDQEEFYQLLSYTDDVDLNKKLQYWEQFYNFNRPHGSLNGQTPYEQLKSLLK